MISSSLGIHLFEGKRKIQTQTLVYSKDSHSVLFKFLAIFSCLYSSVKGITFHLKACKIVTLTAWKVSKYVVFSGPYFPAFGLNTDQKKLRIWTLFTQSLNQHEIISQTDSNLKVNTYFCLPWVFRPYGECP